MAELSRSPFEDNEALIDGLRRKPKDPIHLGMATIANALEAHYVFPLISDEDAALRRQIENGNIATNNEEQ